MQGYMYAHGMLGAPELGNPPVLVPAYPLLLEPAAPTPPSAAVSELQLEVVPI